MSIGSGSRVRISHVAEVTQGQTPGSPSMKTFRGTERNPQAQKTILESHEVTGDRERSDVRHGFASVGGQLGFELSLTSFDDWLEAALGGTFQTVASVTNVSISTTTTFNRASGSFVTDGYRPGDIIRTTGFTTSANNADWRVTAVTALVLTVDGTLATETAGVGKTVAYPGKRLETGTTLTTFTIERAFLDLLLYQVFKGVSVNTMSLDIKPDAIVGGSFGLVGMDPLTDMSGTSLGSPSVVSTSRPFDSFNGTIYEGGTRIAVCTGLELAVDNGRSVAGVVGSRISPEVFEGNVKINGTLSAFFKTAALYNKFINETSSSIWCRLNDPNGTDFMNFTLPRVIYNGDPIEVPEEGPVTESLPFMALRDTTYSKTMWIQRSNT